MDYERDVALYLPAKNGQTMLCFWRTAALRYDQMPAEAVLQLLLQEEGDGRDDGGAEHVGGGRSRHGGELDNDGCYQSVHRGGAAGA